MDNRRRNGGGGQNFNQHDSRLSEEPTNSSAYHDHRDAGTIGGGSNRTLEQQHERRNRGDPKRGIQDDKNGSGRSNGDSGNTLNRRQQQQQQQTQQIARKE